MLGTVPADGNKPVGLRITKVVRGRDDSLYTFLLPGVVPDPLKLSIHPTGEIQLKSRRAGLITRLDKEALLRGVQSGELDAALARFLKPRLDHEPAEGFVTGPDLIPAFQVPTGEPLRDVDVPVDQMLDRLTRVQIEDAAQLPTIIAMLRKEGLLPPKATLHLVTQSSDKPIEFISLLAGPLEGDVVRVPEGLPFPQTMQAVLDSLRLYGGIVFTMPAEGELRELVKTVGLGDLFAGLARFADALDEPEVEERVGEVLAEISDGFRGPARRLARAKPLRPFRKPKRTRVSRSPPSSGWVRRRPRRRGHTAPLRTVD